MVLLKSYSQFKKINLAKKKSKTCFYRSLKDRMLKDTAEILLGHRLEPTNYSNPTTPSGINIKMIKI